MTNLSKFLIPAVLSGFVTTSAFAERIFPPTHISDAANFTESVVSEVDFSRPWYETENLNQVETIRIAEKIEPSPYSSQYYFVLARSYANDLSQEVVRLKQVRENLIASQREEVEGES
ncbi:MAG: hypothetical protein AAF387_19525 [Pseudomonadota bacterium]